MVKGIEEKTGIEAAKDAKKLFNKFKPDLTITDVPTQALNQFRKLAEEEFKPKGGSAHYGFTLKHLLDFYFGKVTEHSLIAKTTADEAIERVSKVEDDVEQIMSDGAEQEKNPKVKKMLDGSERKVF